MPDQPKKLTLEEQRFLDYQTIYRDTTIPLAPENAPPPPAMSNTQRGKKSRQSKITKYGDKGASAAAVARAKSQ